jgi:hypothetical protein
VWGQPAGGGAITPGHIQITTPAIAYVYGFGADNTLDSYHRSGIEKWIFRARHSTQDPDASNNNAAHKEVEADGVYYLWRIETGYTTSTVDRGGWAPVDRLYPLENFPGHRHVRFDKLPAEDEDFLLNLNRRPKLLRHDSDSPRLPPEVFEAVVALAAMFLRGDRTGQLDVKSHYYLEYAERLKRARSEFSVETYRPSPFGDGLGSSRRRTLLLPAYPVKEG